jgi:hypothetical protein
MLFGLTPTNLFLLASLCSEILAPSVSANDTEAEIGLGGLTFTKSDNVEMLSEDLYVSRDQVVVKYLFRNKSSADVESLVAFPLPEFRYSGDAAERSGVSDVEFMTIVDGEPIKADVERKAYLSGIDETAALEQAGVPLNPDEAVSALNRKGPADIAQLKQRGLLDTEGLPAWTAKTTYYWRQLFRAGRQIAIEHRYKPAIGGTVQTAIGTSRWSQVRSFYEKYCVDEAILSAVRAASPRSSDNPPFYETWISYVLTTGANWASPIRNVHVVVDKGQSDNIVSFCADRVRQIAPTQFEFSASNFVPTHDLNVLILNKREPSSAANGTSPVDPTALSCDELWLRRNAIYKANGYCFKTPRAIAQFGNAGCTDDDVDRIPLSDPDRSMIDQIKALEQLKRCAR